MRWLALTLIDLLEIEAAYCVLPIRGARELYRHPECEAADETAMQQPPRVVQAASPT